MFGSVPLTYLGVLTHVDADKESGNALESTEWSLNNTIFNSIPKLWGPYQIDLFASKLNFKVSNYVSWRPDPGTKWTDGLHSPCIGGVTIFMHFPHLA
jgi:hypothetical protein